MNAINRVGMKVACILDNSVWELYFCCDFGCYGPPLYGGIYTVAGFAEIDGGPGIHLRELPGITCPCHGLCNAPWPLEIFRAVDERQTDIGALTKLLEPCDVAAAA